MCNPMCNNFKERKINIIETLEKYLNLLFPALEPGEHIRMMKKKGEFTTNEYFSSIDEAGEVVKKHKRSYDLFIGLATSKVERGQSDDIYRRQVIMVDFDKKDYPALSSCKDFINQFKKNASLIFYHAITDTGGGYHFYVSIEPTDDCKRVAALNRALADLVGADIKAASVTQMDRLPAGLNHKYDPCVPVRVVMNTFGTLNHKPYPLGVLEEMVAKAQQRKEAELEIAQQPPQKCEGVKAFRCAEAMISQGAVQGERNWCLGRIINYLRDIRGYTKRSAYETVKQFNTRCSPPKPEGELKSQFENYWGNSNYRLLGCLLSDPAKMDVLNKYCDKTLCNHGAITSFAAEDTPAVFIGNRMLSKANFRKMRGNDFLLLIALYRAGGGLTRLEIQRELTLDNKKCAICEHTLSASLRKLVQYKYIRYDKTLKRFEAIKTAEYGVGNTRISCLSFTACVNCAISSQNFLVYIALNCLLQKNRSASFEELSNLSGIDKSGISRHISALENAKIIHVNKTIMKNGQYCNAYQCRV